MWVRESDSHPVSAAPTLHSSMESIEVVTT